VERAYAELARSAGSPLLREPHVASFFANPAPLQLVSLSYPHALWLSISHLSLVAPPGMTYVVPAAVWLGVLAAFRVRHASATVAPPAVA